MSRPELTGHASLFYNEKEARKYDSSSRMIGVQREITERAMELLRLNDDTPSFVLDIGCGSGLSGRVLEERGHVWVGCDISRDMLSIAKERMDRSSQPLPDGDKNNNNKTKHKNATVKDSSKGDDDDGDDDNIENSDSDEEDNSNGGTSNGDLLHHDMGTGLPFRPATFDACISISALQWLCYSNSTHQNPKRRLTRFFSSLYTVLKRGGRAVLQFYPETAEQAVLISETATRVGFTGGVVVDYPNSAKAKKHYLVLGFDRNNQARKKAVAEAAAWPVRTPQQQAPPPPPLQNQVQVGTAAGASSSQGRAGKKQAPRKKKGGVKTKEWIIHKKEVQRRKGKDVRADTKYTGRKRPTKF
ncbi:hypothetical protein ACA910_012810 [Epithemia clementina (nom. ined.)]